MALAMLVAFPASSVVFLVVERFGSTAGPRVLASGTATVSGCERQLLREPYACAASAVWHETATFGEPPAEVTVRSTRPLHGEVAVEERDCSRRYASDHLCPVYAADYPSRSHWLDIPPFLTLFGLMAGGWLVARRIVTRITGYPPARADRQN
ncbi:hypothetical protein J2S43_000141 [Catenuloplanes nepalensis]|uniref:Uncharacterized protein n=1 Tax=Catenuloplanes nepalensis TaxID=587533 RepID=A0ABT9MJN9_9ACTN|nr:hypothetical protein [Catenuloplanes nepalensis]MDP9791629.1 hypothetical protein [Catenuloplanes nepalensis]